MSGVWGPFRVVVRDLRGNMGHFMLASLGVTLGIAGFAFLLGLGSGVRNALVGQITQDSFVEFAPRQSHIDFWALRVGLGDGALDDNDLEQLRAVTGVRAVWPRMRLLVPAVATGGESLLGSGLRTEVLADGLDSELIAKDLDREADFDYRRDESNPRPCFSDSDCPSGRYCAYEEGRFQCQPPIPVVVSPQLVDLFNGPFRQAYRLPEINPEAAVGLGIDAVFGASSIRPDVARDRRQERLELVGFSDWATPFGLTMPIEVVKELNESLGHESKVQYQSVIIELVDRSQLSEVSRALKKQGLEPVNSAAEKGAKVLASLLFFAAAAGVGIVLIASINIMHVFLMHIIARTREIGLMRAVGARRSQIVMIILSEAALVGGAAGLCGLILAWGAGVWADRLIQSLSSGFALEVASFFDFSPALVVASLGLSVAACMLGALGPAIRAMRLDPSRAIRRA